MNNLVYMHATAKSLFENMLQNWFLSVFCFFPFFPFLNASKKNEDTFSVFEQVGTLMDFVSQYCIKQNFTFG